MGSRARVALIALSLALAGRGLVAQNPTPAAPAPPRDSLAREQVYDDVFPGGSPWVTLTEGVVYRLEIQPAGATITIRSARQPSPQPLLLIPIEGGGTPGASRTAAYLLVPRATERYRIDVAGGEPPIRVRVETDPREMSRWARMQQETKDLPMAGLSLRGVYLGPFVRPHAAGVPPTGTASAAGVEACFAVVPRGAWARGPLGGCALAVARYARPDSAGGMWFIGTEPAYLLSGPGARVETGIVATLGIGSAVSSVRMDYLALGLDFQVAAAVPGLGRHWRVEAEAGLARLQRLGDGLEPDGQANVVPHFGLGLQLRF